MSIPSRSSSLPASSRSGVGGSAFPPRPKSVRIWVVNEPGLSNPASSATQAAQAGARPVRRWRTIVAVFTVVLAVTALVALARMVQEQLGN